MIIPDELQRLRQALNNDRINALLDEASKKDPDRSDAEVLMSMFTAFALAVVDVTEQHRRTVSETQAMLEGIHRFIKSSQDATEAVGRKFNRVDRRLEQLEELVEDLLDGMSITEAHLEMQASGEKPLPMDELVDRKGPKSSLVRTLKLMWSIFVESITHPNQVAHLAVDEERTATGRVKYHVRVKRNQD